MLFSSFSFLFLFLPVFLAVYFLCPPRWRTAVIFFFSLLFCGLGSPVAVVFLLLSAVAHYWFGRLAERGRAGVALAVGFDLSLLLFFKYYDAAASLLGWSALGLSLPLGLSFYSFFGLAYVIDVSRGAAAERRPLPFLAQFSFFPKLLSGPITRYDTLRGAMAAPVSSYGRAMRGIERFLCGLSKKLLLAAPASEMWEYLRDLPGEARGVFGAWLALLFYAFWLYYDFSGYTDMAIGLGEILGFSLPENFQYPYTAHSPRDFWRRWHITLSAWFRDYVYIPLGGSRRGAARTVLNLLAVWLLTGLWHGATPNFLAWGLYWFFFLALSRTGVGRLCARMPKGLRRALMLPLILVSWLIFAYAEPSALAAHFLGLFCGVPLTPLVGYELLRSALLLGVLTLGSTPWPRRWYEKRVKGTWAALALCLVGLFLSLAYLVGGTHQPFLYLDF